MLQLEEKSSEQKKKKTKKVVWVGIKLSVNNQSIHPSMINVPNKFYFGGTGVHLVGTNQASPTFRNTVITVAIPST